MAKNKQWKKQDNSTFSRKVSLRRLMLSQVEQPVIMETHGGYGRIWLEVYHDLKQGIVFEKDPYKVGVLAEQRPTWAVYQADCERAIRAGAGSHLAVNVLDVDPYGEPWTVIDAFFASDRPRPSKVWVVVQDGLRANVRFGTSWQVGQLEPIVQKYGNDLFKKYLDVCRELMQIKAAQAGYRLDRFAGYYCGAKDQMTHYLSVLVSV